MGEPRHLSGASGASAQDASDYSQALADRIADVPVNLIDERLSTVTAASHLREGGIDSRKQRSGDRPGGRRGHPAAVSSTAGGPDRDRPGGPRARRRSTLRRATAPADPVAPRWTAATGSPGPSPAVLPGRRRRATAPPRYEAATAPVAAGLRAADRRRHRATGGVRRVSGLLDRRADADRPARRARLVGLRLQRPPRPPADRPAQPARTDDARPAGERPAPGRPASLRAPAAAAVGRLGPAAAPRHRPGDDDADRRPPVGSGPARPRRTTTASTTRPGTARTTLGRRRPRRRRPRPRRGPDRRLGGPDRRPRRHRRPRRGRGAPRRRGRRERRRRDRAADGLVPDVHDEALHDGTTATPTTCTPTTSTTTTCTRRRHSGDDIPVKPYDRRTGRPRRRRRPVAVLISLLVLAGLVVGIVVGGQKLLGLIDPTARTTPARAPATCRSASRTATRSATSPGRWSTPTSSPRPARSSTPPRPTPTPSASSPASTACGSQMSGQAALDLLLDPASRLLSRVTLPEGLTVAADAGQRIAEETGTPGRGVPGRRGRPRRAGPAGLRQRAARGLPLPGDLRRRARRRRRRTSSGRWSPGSTQVARRAADPEARARLTVRRPRRSLGAGRGRLGRGHGQGRPGAGEPARRRHAAAAGHDGELRQRQGRDHHHGRRTAANPSPYNTYVHAGLPPGADQQPGRGRAAGGADADHRATGCSSWSSTPTPATPGSPRPRGVQAARQRCASRFGCGG